MVTSIGGQPIPEGSGLIGLPDENRTLYGVIRLVSSPLELTPMLQGVVALATEATGCHACFIYLLEGETLTIRAASPVFAQTVGNVSFSIQDGLTGWVARHRTPEFIRDEAMRDPRMKYVPELQEERFQSMVAVPILSRAGATIGVIVLHTRAPHEFSEDTLKLLVHIASLVSGAIENAQLYDRERRRVDSLTDLSKLAQQVAAASAMPDLSRVVTAELRRLTDAEVAQLYRLDPLSSDLELLASVPESIGGASTTSATKLMLTALEGRSIRSPADTLWPELEAADLLVTPLTIGDDRIGLLCAGSRARRRFTEEDAELARAIAHLTAVAIKRLELIERLTNANIVKDLFEALAAGATAFAASKASEVYCDLSSPYAIAYAEPARGLEQGSSDWRAAAGEIAAALRAEAPRAAVEVGPGPVRALLPLVSRRPDRIAHLLETCRSLGGRFGAVIGVSDPREAVEESARAYREAVDAATIGRALLGSGGLMAYSQLGAYRYLVRIRPEEAPRDQMRAAVDLLIEYDRRRHTALLDTLERYLAERSSVVESARALLIHPNTLRQRLGRIEDLTGVRLVDSDLLSLELAIKLARLHGMTSTAPEAVSLRR